MQGLTRRGFLATSGLLVVGTTAGCLTTSGPSTPADPETVGDVHAINGVEITFVDFMRTTELAYVPRGEQVTVADDAPDREVETVTPTSVDRSFLLLVIRIGNTSGESKRIPTSAPTETAFTAGRIYLERGMTELQPVPVEANADDAIGGAWDHDGTWLDRLVLVVGSVGGELPGGTTITGWILYRIPTDLDLGELELVAHTNPSGPNRRLTWAFPDE